MLNDGKKKSDIAKALGFHRSTISREISKNLENGEYLPKKAQENYEINRKYCVSHKNWNLEIYKLIIDKLKEGFSPDAIAGRQKILPNESMRISHQTIYNWVIKGRLGESMQKYLLYGKKGYAKSKNSLKSLKNKSKKRVDTMPEEARKGLEIGHFQGDTLQGAKQSGAIATFVDLKSKFILADKMQDKTANSFSRSMQISFADIDNDKLKTILEDNGSEMSNFESDEEMLNCKIFFTYPGRPWEKAHIENSNRLIRRFFPKNMSFQKIENKDVLQAVEWLNKLPRKSLNYRTAYEVFHDIKPVAFDT
jgi:IS30 family transposase